MTSTPFRLILLLVCLGLGACERSAEDLPTSLPRSRSADLEHPQAIPSPDLYRDGEDFVHRRAEVRMRVPASWRAEGAPTNESAISILKLVRDDGLKATITFAPLERELVIVAAEQMKTLRSPQMYGKERVSVPYPDYPARKRGYRIDIAPKNAPESTGNAGERGVVWFFEAIPERDQRWRIRLRVTLPPGIEASAIEPIVAGWTLPHPPRLLAPIPRESSAGSE